MNKQILDAIYTMARLGLAEVAKDMDTAPKIVAQHASALELWRVTMEKQLAEPQPTDAKPSTDVKS